MKRRPIIAIDGPAGSGKSTVTKLVAEKLKLLYLDTGAMYRALSWLMIKESIDYKKEKKIQNFLTSFTEEILETMELIFCDLISSVTQ